jgi:cytochrome c oxidase subunit IV
MSAHDMAQHEPPGQTATGVHVVPAKVLLGVWGSLLVLTVATVAVTQVDLGPFNLWVALAIAVVKAGLVALYFMHLRYDHPFNGFLLVAALLFVGLLVGAALTDTHQYESQLIPGYAPAIQK